MFALTWSNDPFDHNGYNDRQTYYWYYSLYISLEWKCLVYVIYIFVYIKDVQEYFDL